MNKILLTLAAALTFNLAACAQSNKKTDMNGQKTLVAYFSATGTTARAARQIAQLTGGELYAITPKQAYTSDDLNWNDRQSRSSVEMNDAQSRPELNGLKGNIDSYDVVFIGYPIWWDEAPRIINSFIESHHLQGKKLIPFATSGGSSIDNSIKRLKKTYSDLNWRPGRLLNSYTDSSLQQWIEQALR